MAMSTITILLAFAAAATATGIPSLTTNERYTYMSLARYGIPSAKSESLKFEFRACKNAILALVSSDKKSLYEVVLGSRDNSMTQIRQGRMGSVVASTAAATGLVKPADCARYRPYWISWSMGWIKVGTGNVVGKTVVLSYKYVPGFQVKYIAVATFGVSGLWRFNTECTCSNGGVCVTDTKEKKGWRCSCPPGWTGPCCCTKCPCVNGGRCIWPTTKCKCPSSFTGSKCETDSCQCKNGGTCKNGRCICPDGFVGKKCETKIHCCRLWGDPHMVTFDGARLDFQGTCRYKLIKICGCAILPKGTPSFSVEVKNWHKGKTGKRVSWVKSVDAHVSGHKITIDQKGELTVNGFKKTLPYKQVPHATISREADGRSVRIDTDYGATVRFDGKANLVICVPEIWMGKLCGLCGNFDNNRENDYVTKQGDKLEHIKRLKSRAPMIAASWRLPLQAGEECEEMKVETTVKQSTTWAEKAKTTAYCGLIVERTGPFAKCIARLAPTKIMEYYTACTFDVVEVSEKPDEAKSIACNSLEAFANECDELNLRPSLRWRTISSCKVTCPKGMTYKEDVTACPNTCAEPKASESCNAQNADGCACPEGTLVSGRKCVKESQCGCTDKEGNYFEPNDYSFTEDCKHKWVCEPGTVEKKSKLVRQAGCTRFETCKMKDGVAKCIPLPVNGEWSNWSKWSSCFRMAGYESAIMLRTRACDNPAPKNGGSCKGKSLEIESCLEGTAEM